MTTHAAEHAGAQPAPTWAELQDTIVRDLHETVDQADQSRSMAQAYLRTVLQNEDLTPEARASLDEAHAILNLQGEAIALVKNFTGLLPNPAAQPASGG